jgi:MYXO-CTERM domain-containing protein
MRFRIRSLAAAAVLALCAWLWLGAAPALAHTELQSSSPEQGAVLDAAPKTVRLTFTEDLGGGSLAVTVSGQSVGAGAARVDGADLVLDIAPGSPAGAWTVAFRVVSADGHPVTGQFAFTVEPERLTARPTPEDTPSPTPLPTVSSTTTATTHPSGHSSGMAGESPTVEVTVTMLALAALVLGVFARRRRP